MTVGMIEGVLLMGMVGLIWMMLDIFVHQPLRSSPALEKLEVMVSLPAALIERLRNTAYWTGNPPLADLVAEAIEDIVTQMEEINGETFPQHVSPLKREVMTGRALSGPLR